MLNVDSTNNDRRRQLLLIDTYVCHVAQCSLDRVLNINEAVFVAESSPVARALSLLSQVNHVTTLVT